MADCLLELHEDTLTRDRGENRSHVLSGGSMASRGTMGNHKEGVRRLDPDNTGGDLVSR